MTYIIIPQGEAKVIKNLTSSVVNLSTQKRRVQTKLDTESEFFQANKFINFEAESELGELPIAKGRS